MSIHADLSSIMSTFDQALERLDESAREVAGGPEDDVVADIYEVERHLRQAQRRLKRAIDYLEGA
ncbi:MAG: hypothetical protein V9F03_11730 [Microthrixaceae bacterium]